MSPLRPAMLAPIGVASSALPSAAMIMARRGSRPARRTTASSRPRPGSRSEKFQSTPASSPLPDTGTCIVPVSVLKMSVLTRTGTAIRPSRSSPSRPALTTSTPAARSALA